MGTITNIMQTIIAGQERTAQPKICRRAGWYLLPQEQFLRVLAGEKKRSERFSKHMIFMQLSVALGSEPTLLARLAPALGSILRETDITGWFEPNSSLGVIFTELGDSDVISAERVIRARIAGLLENATSSLEFARLQMSFRAFCSDRAESKENLPTVPVFQRARQAVVTPKLGMYRRFVSSKQPLAETSGSGSL